jgi:hypothetical protein
MLLGAVVGWAVIGPVAHSKGWVSLPGSGDAQDATNWLSWLALAVMVGDSLVRDLRSGVGLYKVTSWME